MWIFLAYAIKSIMIAAFLVLSKGTSVGACSSKLLCSIALASSDFGDSLSKLSFVRYNDLLVNS